MGARAGSGLVTSQEFVGRFEELARVSAAVERALDGRAQLVWIEGEAGSGKTGLTRAVLEGLPPEFQVFGADADELAGDVDLELAGQFGALSATDGFGAGLELLDLFGLAQDAGPLAIVVEDFQWADSLSRQALLTVARRLRNDRVVMLITTRPESGDDGWDRFVSDRDRCVRVAVGALTTNDVGKLAHRYGAPLDRQNIDRLHRHTQGHVLYVRTLLTELSLQQLNSPETDLPAPRSLASTTTARVADLPHDAQSLASAMAVVNQRRPLRLVGTIAGVSDPEEALEPLLDTGFVRWTPSEMGTPVEYTHPLFRTAVYDDLSPTRRRDLHLAAAASLDPETSLVHRVAAASPGDEALVEDLFEAADRESNGGALGIAARDLLWASTLSSDLDQIERGLLQATRLLLADGQLHRAMTLQNQVAAVRSQPLRSLLLGRLAWVDGDASSAELWLADAARRASEDPNAVQLEIDALIQLAILYVTLGRGSEAFDAARQVLARGSDDKAAEVQAWCELAKAEAWLHGAPSGLDLLTERLGADPLTVVPPDADLLVIRGALGFFAGRTLGAIADLRTALQLMRLGAPATQLARAHLQLAHLLIIAGEWDDALVHARLGMSVVEDGGHVWFEAQAHAALASVWASRGEWDEAANHVSRARGAADATGIAEAVFTARIAEGAVARARADAAGVINALTPLIGSGESATMPMNTSLGWWPVAIHAHIDVGDLSTAEQQVRQLRVAAVDRRLDFDARLVGLQARLNQAQGEPEAAGSAFAQAVAAMGPDEALLDRALLHHEFGRLLHGRGRRQAAVTQLTLAHDLLGTVRAEPYRRRVEQDLEACGLRSERAAHRSPLGLTEREQDVAALVSKGMTNREVAAQLYVSSKAVEYHLRNIFGKLGISSRTELRAALSV